MALDQVRQLLAACEEGNTAAVQSILDQGLSVNSSGDMNTTALQIAAANGHENLVRLLLMRGAALDQPNSYGWTPLLLACRHGYVSVVALLLSNKADVNARTKLGANALTLAGRCGHLQTCKLLMEAGIDLSPSTGIGGSTCEFTPVMAAAHHGHDAVVRYLLDRGFDVNFRTPSTGVNALMLSALNGHMTTAQILVEKGADPNLTNVNNHTPLQVAKDSKKREVLGYLDRKTTNKPRVSPEDVKPDIIHAAKKGDIQRLREILDEDITQRDAASPQDGATPLMFAAMTGNLTIAQLLVERGCDINKQDTVSGWSALMQATYHGKKNVAKFLINAGADVLIPAKNGCTAFDMASLIEDVDTELFRLLAAKAMQVKPVDKPGHNWSSKQNGTASSISSATATVSPMPEPGALGEHPKNGLKAWLNRMSNRFRNLKLGRTFNMTTNRLTPLPSESPASSPVLKKASESASENGEGLPKKSISASEGLGTTNASSITTITSYETMMLETRKSASVYTLGLNAPTASVQDGSTLKPVIPPFLPPPTFETDRPKMPPVSKRRSVHSGSTMTLNRRVPPMKLLQSYSTSTQNLTNIPSSPSVSTRCIHSNSASPSSSTGASTLSGTNKSRVSSSDGTSSTLTAGSDNLNKSGGSGTLNDAVFVPVQRAPPGRQPGYFTTHSAAYSRAPVFPKSSHTSSSSGSGGSSFAKPPRKHSRGKSTSSRDSCSTLTPSSPSPKQAGSPSTPDNQSSLSASKSTSGEEDELGGLLKKLSLERYQPIFEEQEVDMEAFLTLTDLDLKELGISHNEPRRQILVAITELNSGKGRERRHFQETMNQFESTMRSRQEFSGDSEMDFSSWGTSIQEESQQPDVSHKSRSS